MNTSADPTPCTGPCEFQVTLANPADALARAQREILAAGGRFDGTLASGTFSGKTLLGEFDGTYTASGPVIQIQISRKPFLVPCGLIESKLREFFRP